MRRNTRRWMGLVVSAGGALPATGCLTSFQNALDFVVAPTAIDNLRYIALAPMAELLVNLARNLGNL